MATWLGMPRLLAFCQFVVQLNIGHEMLSDGGMAEVIVQIDIVIYSFLLSACGLDLKECQVIVKKFVLCQLLDWMDKNGYSL